MKQLNHRVGFGSDDDEALVADCLHEAADLRSDGGTETRLDRFTKIRPIWIELDKLPLFGLKLGQGRSKVASNNLATTDVTWTDIAT